LVESNDINEPAPVMPQLVTDGPDLLAIPRWEQERAVFRSLCLRALSELREDLEVEHSEPDLNRRLVRMFNRARRQMELAGQVLHGQIVPEAKCLPNLRRPRFEAREKTIPDFRYQYTDTKELADFSTKEVVAECKRLGRVERRREFNKLYVHEGIMRFQRVYADTSPSAFMIGYMQDMQPAAVQIEVNVESQKNKLNRLTLSPDGWIESGVSMLTQSFERGDPPESFSLDHLWLDLRGSAKSAPAKPVRRNRNRRI
jgi:hypothetical protein